MDDKPGIEHDHIRSFVDLLESADRVGAIAMARRLLDEGVAVEVLLEDLVCPAQVEVGKRWQSATWDIGREHAATSVSEAVIAALALEVPATAHRGTMVVACVDGEWHSLPARVLAEVLRVHGWDVKFLGAATPTPHLIRYLNDEGPDALAISCSVPFSLGGARSVIEASRQSGIPVLAGGRAFGDTPHRAELLGANAWCRTASEAPKAVESWPVVVTGAPPLVHEGFAELTPLVSMTDQLVSSAGEELLARRRQVEQSDGLFDEPLHAELRTIVLFLQSALLCDDVSVLADYCAWLESLGERTTDTPTAEQLDSVLSALPLRLRRARSIVETVLAQTAAIDPAGNNPAG